MRRVLATLGVTTLVATALSGCGSKDERSSGAQAGAIVAAVEKANADNPTGRTSKANRAVLEKLVARLQAADVFVTYRTGKKVASVAQDGKGNVAYIERDTREIVTRDGKYITCSGTDRASAKCREVPGGSAQPARRMKFAAAEVVYLESLVLTGAKASRREIAGRQATCVRIDFMEMLRVAGRAVGQDASEVPSKGSPLRGVFCLDDKTGFGLELDFGDHDPDGMVATEFRGSKPSDFEPPATLKSLSDLTSGSDSGGN